MVTHADVMKEIAEQFQPILEHSPDGVYLWLDDGHKICNQRLARLFGYTMEEWQSQSSSLESCVAEEDQEMFAWNYNHRVATLAFPVTFRFRGRRKDGSTFAAETD